MTTGAPVKRAPAWSAPTGNLGDVLVADGLLSRAQLDYALTVQRQTRRSLGAVLLELNVVAEPALHAFLASRWGLESIDLNARAIDRDMIALLPAELARKHQTVPVGQEPGAMTVALADPTNGAAIDEIGFATGLRVRVALAPRAQLRRALIRYYGIAAEPARLPVTPKAVAMALLRDIDAEVGAIRLTSPPPEPTPEDLLEVNASPGESPVMKIVNRILIEAIERGASDLHLEPFEHELRVRLRIDGMLHEAVVLPKALEPALMSRLKVMGNLDIAERRLPQDGRIRLRYDDRAIDLRVSVVPTLFGEKASVRILDRDAASLTFASLGFDSHSEALFRSAVGQPYGMVLVTGPTGSGKTTTLYAAINALNSSDVHIVTVEDPIEYRLRGINQVQVHEAIGRTFAATLRSFLRQDPDIVMVGEMRDTETAQISVRSALTGHLVLSTIHTNDCPSTIARLIDMGIPPFLLASSLLLVVAQRLVRTLCAECAEPYPIDAKARGVLGALIDDERVLHRGKGCGACNYTGFKGRQAIYEVMPLSEELREAVARNAPTATLRALAQAHGMRTLREIALEKALEGATALDEALRVTGE